MSLSTMRNNILKFCPGLLPDIVSSTIQDAYRQLGRLEWNRLRVSRQIYTIPPYTTGTVTIDSLGVVTGVGTTFTSDMVGRWFRIDDYEDSCFEILTYTDISTITLRSWTGETISTATTFSIFKSVYTLDTAMRVVEEVVYQSSLTKKGQDFLNRQDPTRVTTGSPTWWAYDSYNTGGYPNIEIYPVPDAVYPLRVYGVLGTVTLGENDTPYLDEDLIEAKALLDCYRIKARLEPKMGWEDMYVIQRTSYQEMMAIAQDEDYRLEAHKDKVKDYMDTADDYPHSNTFITQHDVE